MTVLPLPLPNRQNRRRDFERVVVKSKDGTQSFEPYLYTHTRTGILYVRRSKVGKGVLFKSTKETKLGRARTIRDELLQEFENEHLVGRRIRVRRVCEELLAQLEKEHLTVNEEHGGPMRSAATIEKDRGFLRAADKEKELDEGTLRKLFGDRFIDEIDEEFLADWRVNEGRAIGRTLFDVYKYISKMITFAYGKKYIKRRPMIEIPQLETKKHVIYTLEQIQGFFDKAEPLLQDLIVGESTCGTRPHEIEGLMWEWITFGLPDVEIHLPSRFTKTRSGRSFKASPAFAQVLRRRYKTRGLSPHVFPGPKTPTKAVSKKHVSRMWRRMLILSGVKPGTFRFTWIRHFFATFVIHVAKQPISDVAAYQGTSERTLKKNYVIPDTGHTAAVAKAVQIDFGGRRA